MRHQDELLYFCADLVTIRFRGSAGKWRKGRANLEEISERHASLLANSRIPHQTQIRILGPDCELTGRVCHTAKLPYLGHCIGIQFDPGCAWSPDLFRPQHLLATSDVPGIRHSAQTGMQCSCCMAACPALPNQCKGAKELTTEQLLTLTKVVARECPTLGRPELELCFRRLVGGNNETFLLFQDMYWASGRRRSA